MFPLQNRIAILTLFLQEWLLCTEKQQEAYGGHFDDAGALMQCYSIP